MNCLVSLIHYYTVTQPFMDEECWRWRSQGRISTMDSAMTLGYCTESNFFFVGNLIFNLNQRYICIGNTDSDPLAEPQTVSNDKPTKSVAELTLCCPFFQRSWIEKHQKSPEDSKKVLTFCLQVPSICEYTEKRPSSTLSAALSKFDYTHCYSKHTAHKSHHVWWY